MKKILLLLCTFMGLDGGFNMSFAFTVGTQNLYHYNTRNLERRVHLYSEMKSPGVGQIMGFQEAARWVGTETLYDYFIRLSGYTGAYQSTNSFGFMNDAVALVSSFPSRDLQSLSLPKTELLSRQFINFGVFETEVGPILAVNVHLSPQGSNAWRRVFQAEFILKQIEQVTMPVVILGDLNDAYDSETLGIFKKAGFVDVLDGKEATYVPGKNPLVTDDRWGASRLDYILYRPLQLKLETASLAFTDNWISDHYGLKARFSIVPNSAR